MVLWFEDAAQTFNQSFVQIYKWLSTHFIHLRKKQNDNNAIVTPTGGKADVKSSDEETEDDEGESTDDNRPELVQGEVHTCAYIF